MARSLVKESFSKMLLKDIDSLLWCKRITIAAALIKIYPYLNLYNHQNLISVFCFSILAALLVVAYRGLFWGLGYLLSGFMLLLLFAQWPFVEFNPEFHTHHVQLLAYALILLSISEWNQKLSVKSLKFLAFFVYVCALAVKANFDFISGGRLQQIVMSYYFDSTAFTEVFSEVFFKGLSWVTILIEFFLTASFLIPVKKVKLIAVYIGILFHLALQICLPVSTFSIQMIALLLLHLYPHKSVE